MNNNLKNYINKLVKINNRMHIGVDRLCTSVILKKNYESYY